MDKLRYNIISQKFITECSQVPLIETLHSGCGKYNISLDVINTDYITSFFRSYNVSQLYSIYIVEKDNFCSTDYNVISVYNKFNKNIYVVKVEPSFFMNIEYNNINDLSLPIFFMSNDIKNLNIEDVLGSCLYEKKIILGSFEKIIVKADVLKLLEGVGVVNIVKFYTRITEEFIENILKLQSNVLDSNDDYVIKLEIGLV